MDKKGILQLAGNRTKLVNHLVEQLEKRVINAQRDLVKYMVDDFLDGMEKDEAGNIKNTLANKRRFSMFETVYNRYAAGSGLEVVKGVADGVARIVDFNSQYFSAFAEPAQLAPINEQVKTTLSAWLGLTPRGKVEPNGYLDTLIKDASVGNQIKNIVIRSVTGQAGYFETKKTLGDFIQGNKDQTGALQKYYRNFVYDTFSQVDRANANIFADKLKFNYAIYEGGLIKTSRAFCKEKNGKVFSREEIAKFDPEEAKPPGYNPFTDLGGYGCRHHLNWVPDALAFALRPELRNQAKPPAEETPPAPEPKPEPVAEKPKTAKATTKKQAGEIAKEALAKGYGFDVARVTISPKLDMDTINDYLTQLQELTRDYNITPVGVGTDKISVSFNSGKTYAGVVKTWKSGEIVAINFGSTTKAPYRGENWEVKKGKLPMFSRVDADKEHLSTLTHEFAHVIGTARQGMHTNANQKTRNFWVSMHKLRDEYTKKLGEIFNMEDPTEELNKFYLGKYANTNVNEFMAEAWTEYKLFKSPSPYAKKVGELIDEYFKND